MAESCRDLDVVTRLLEEKEKDLEMAAKIGQQLLARNKQMEERLGQLEGDLQTAGEAITQLRHDLHVKTELLHIYSNDADESGSEGGTPSGQRRVPVEFLQARIGQLELENGELKADFRRMTESTESLECREKELVKDVVWELSDANMTINSLSDELSARVEENMQTQERMTDLLAQLVESQSQSKYLSQENDELRRFLGANKEAQSELADEVSDLKDKYALLQAMYHDAQQQVKRREKPRNANLPSGAGDSLQPDSLASELEKSMSPFLPSGDGVWSATGRRRPSSRGSAGGQVRSVFDTIRCAQRSTSRLSTDSSSPLYCSSSLAGFAGSVSSRVVVGSSAGTLKAVSSPPFSLTSQVSGGELQPRDSGLWMKCQDTVSVVSDSDYSVCDESEADLPWWRDEGGSSSRDSFGSVNLLVNAVGVPVSACDSDGMRTPESIMSCGSSRYSSVDSNGVWRRSDKLQIVKPLAGSVTLHHWSRLATPHLGGLLEDRPGISSRVERRHSRMDSAGNSQLPSEESDDGAEDGGPLPALYKTATNTSGVYTLTNTVVTSRSVTSTFSTHLGLARALQERSQRVDAAALPDTKCTTPANSPQSSRSGSPTRRRAVAAASDQLVHGGLRLSVVSAAARRLRQPVAGIDGAVSAPSYSRNQEPARPTALNRRVLQRVTLLERMQRLGLGEAVAAVEADQRPSSPSVTGLCTRRSGAVPRRGRGPRPAAASEGRRRPALGTVPDRRGPPPSSHRSRSDCVGSVGVLSVGRKGGYL